MDKSYVIVRYVCQTVSFVMLSGDRPQKMENICTLLDVGIELFGS